MAWATAEWVSSKQDPHVKGTPGVGLGGLGEWCRRRVRWVVRFGEGRATARAAPPAAAAARRGACMEAGRLNATNTTWRRGRVPGTSKY